MTYKTYQQPKVTVVYLQHEQCLLEASQQGGMSGTISGYKESTSGGFNQGGSVKSQSGQDVWDDDWSKQ